MIRSPVPLHTWLAPMLALLLAACGDDGRELSALKARLAESTAEANSLRASRRVLDARLSATREAAQVAAARVGELDKELARERMQASARLGTEAGLRQALDAARADVTGLQGELAAATRMLEDQGRRNEELSHRLAAVSGWLGQQSAYGQSQDLALKGMQSEVQRRTRSQASMEEQLAASRSELAGAVSEAARIRAANEALEKTVVTLRSEVDALRAGTDERARLSTTNGQLKERLESLRSELAQANDRADRQRRARAYLTDKVEQVDQQIAGLRAQASSLRSERDETARLLVSQREELSRALAESQAAHGTAGARVTALEARRDELNARVEALEKRNAEIERAEDGARRAKDYLDGKLGALETELERTRKENRTRVLRLEEALRLSVEEARVLHKRGTGIEAARADEQQRVADLERALAETQSSLEQARGETQALRTRVAIYERTFKYLRTRREAYEARLTALEDAAREARADSEQLTADLAEARSQAKACADARTDEQARLRDVQSSNDTLRGQVEALEKRVRELEAELGSCKLRRTAL